MGEETLAELERLTERATPGPWHCQGADVRYVARTVAQADILVNAEFIAAAREAVPALIAEVRRLRAALGPLVERTPVDHGRMEEALCGYCDGYLGFRADDPQEHSADCPWVLARDILHPTP